MEKKDIAIAVKNESAHLTVPDPFYDRRTCERLQITIEVEMARGTREFFIDFGGLKPLSSYSMGHLLKLNDQIKEAGGKLTLKGFSPDVRAMLKALLVDQLLTIEA